MYYERYRINMMTPNSKYTTLGKDVWKQLETILQCATDGDDEALVDLLQDPSIERHHTIQLSLPGYGTWTKTLDIVNVENIQPNTALTVAVMRRNTNVARVLLEFRADINPDRCGGDEASETLFDLAKGNEDMMNLLLSAQSAAADPKFPVEMQTPSATSSRARPAASASMTSSPGLKKGFLLARVGARRVAGK